MSEPTRVYERMLAELPYHVPDAELFAMQQDAQIGVAEVNATIGQGFDARRPILKRLLGSFGESFLEPPVRWEYGTHIHIGDACLVNSNCVFMDGAEIRIGDRTLIAPNVMLVTAGHPILPEERVVLNADGSLSHGTCINRAITIGCDCWIGAGAIILPGVTIEDGTIVGAGSVVTKSMPRRVVVAGNPARVIRKVD